MAGAAAVAVRTQGAPSKAVRRDPAKRRLSAVENWSELVNPRPDMKYVFVNLGAVTIGSVDQYDAMGFERSVKGDGPDGLDAAFGSHRRKPGDLIEVNGMALMELALEDWEDIEAQGAGGTGGQAYWDKIQARLADKKATAREILAKQRTHSASGDTYFSAEVEKDKFPDEP